MSRASSEAIRSRQNTHVKALRAAATKGGHTADGSIAIEGGHLLKEASRHRVEVQQIFVRENVQSHWEAFVAEHGLGTVPMHLLSTEVFDSAVETPASQGIAAFVRQPTWDMECVLAGAKLVVVLCGVQDPGNVGTVIRSSAAFGAAAVFCLPGCADPFGNKALRASAGAAFATPVFVRCWDEVRAQLDARGIATVASVPLGGMSPGDIAWGHGAALLIGSEGSGLPEDIVKAADARVTVPMAATSESLNAAVAAGILLYEAARALQPGERA